MKRTLAGLVLLSLVLIACTPQQITHDPSAVESTLTDFFKALSDGEYERAVQLYGGSYESLRAMNPQSDPDDLVGLWKLGCEVNGLVCLPVNRVIEAHALSETETLFVVEFLAEDGQVFALSPCCGAQEGTAAPQSAFEFRVRTQNEFSLIEDIPALIP